MTNGEKIQKDFKGCEVCEPIVEDNIIHVIFADKKDSAIGFDWDWWNAEYQEPTTKNDKVDCKHIDCNNCVNHKYCDYESSSSEKPNNSTTKNNFGVDAVSRQEIIGYIDYILSHGMGKKKSFDFIKKFVANLPSVTPQEPRWIPVSERLPEEETDVLICNKNGDIEFSRGSYSTEVENYFMWYTSGWRFGKVIAWMPLPKPYSEVEE